MRIKNDDLYPDIYGLYLYFLDKGHTKGLTYSDLKALKRLEQDISDRLIISDNKWFDLYNKISSLKQEMYQSGIFHKYRYEGINYLKENTYILPLVLANDDSDKIKMYSDASYYFSCQFHNERTPSMGVSDDKNFFYCFGCGQSGDAIRYLKSYENLNFKEAIELLSTIYLIDPEMKNNNSQEQAKKYQETIIGPRYQELLEIGKKRLERRNQNEVAYQSVEDFYQKRYSTIERVKAKEYDQNFTVKKLTKRMYLD